MGEDILRRLDELDRNVETLLVGQRDLSATMSDVQKKMRDVLLEIGGAPDAEYREPGRKSIRARIHDLEQVKYAAGAAGAALGLLFGRMTRWAMLVGIMLGMVGAAASVLRLFGVGGG